MKITYTPNPLNTIIELDDCEKKELWYKLKIETMHWQIVSAYFHLEEGSEYYDVKRARDELNHEDYYEGKDGGKSRLDEEVDRQYGYYYAALSQPHGGDCTCVACSCTKCHVESLLGVDTIPGLKKHEASKIGGTFRPRWEAPERSIDEVLGLLIKYTDPNYVPKADWEGWEAHSARWKQEGINAYNWLKKYKEDHFPS